MVDKCFISINTKPTEEAHWQPYMKKIVQAGKYTKQSVDNVVYAIQELEGLRRNAVGRVLDRTHTSLEILHRYYDQLGSLEAKIPAIAYQVPFKWSSAFDKAGIFSSSRYIAQSAIGFEKICVVFNIGALSSQIAAHQNLESDDGLKAATTDFQKSAGAFQHVKDHVQSTIQQEPTPDLSQDALAALVALMTAQAQEVFFFKSAKEQMKDVVVAKIAAQTADYYASALKLMQKDNLRASWDKEWLPIVECKNLGYAAIAEYYHASVHRAAKEFGEELARLQLSLELLARAKRVYDTPQYPFRKMENMVRQAFETAKKDNDFIYHVKVPEAKTLEPVPRAAFVKVLNPTFPMSHGFVDLFQPLVSGPADSSCVIC